MTYLQGDFEVEYMWRVGILKVSECGLASLRDTTLPKFSLRQATSAAEWLGGTL